jgi:hypothetical protein
MIRRGRATSPPKWTHVVHNRPRDEIEAPLTGWLRQAYRLEDKAAKAAARKPRRA